MFHKSKYVFVDDPNSTPVTPEELRIATREADGIYVRGRRIVPETEENQDQTSEMINRFNQINFNETEKQNAQNQNSTPSALNPYLKKW